ncbi:FGGY-family carbohydrate kinase [Yoonia maritima]|uniref:FGGY-family carbohydrate kinase n=1 Tax=Yoonia maritima TaxID=1435347 RepID=UPI003736FBC0
MTDHQFIAVIDVGKTNAKLALVDADTLDEVAVRTRPNTVLPGPPWPHFDLEGHCAFFLEALTEFGQTHVITGISITTHGAAVVLLDKDGALAAPMLDYEHTGPDDRAAEYGAIRPEFSQTGSPRLPMGLNVGAQLDWQFTVDPTLRDRTAHILTYPQYWAWRLTGVMATEVTSLGCHTDLWNPYAGDFSSLVDTLGISGKLPAAQKSGAIAGQLADDIATQTGLSSDIPVAFGIHDSNASLYPHVIGQDRAFSVVSTGTWVIAMAVGGAQVTLDPARDTLINVNALGAAVPSARFMGGRSFEDIRGTSTADPNAQDRMRLIADGVMLLPSVVQGSGPYPDRMHSWTVEPETDGARMLGLSYYLALMTDTCLNLIGATGPTIIEGPFARNADYLDMLAAIRPDGVCASAASTGTSAGSALLLLDDAPYQSPPKLTCPSNVADLQAYASAWRDHVNQG